MGAPCAALCRAVALRIGIAPFDVWAGNPDPGAAEVVEFVNEAVAMVADAHAWTALRRRVTWAREAERGGGEERHAWPGDCRRLHADTVGCGSWAGIPGPVGVDEWERAARSGATRPMWTTEGRWLVARGLPDAYALTARYQALVSPFAADRQTVDLPDRPVILGALMLYREAKGLPIGSAPAQYLAALAAARSEDRPLGMLSLGGRREPGEGDFTSRRNPLVLDEDGVLG